MHQEDDTLPQVSQLMSGWFRIGILEVWLQSLGSDHSTTMPLYSPSRCSLNSLAAIIRAPLGQMTAVVPALRRNKVSSQAASEPAW